MAPEAPTSGVAASGALTAKTSAGNNAAGEIENQEADAAHRLFDVVAENPQEQHVAGNVQEAAVQEHVGEKRRVRRNAAGRRPRRSVAAGTSA